MKEIDLEIETVVGELRNIIAGNASEERVYRLVAAWLVILRDAYHANRKQFSDEQLEFLKQVRTLS